MILNEYFFFYIGKNRHNKCFCRMTFIIIVYKYIENSYIL